MKITFLLFISFKKLLLYFW